MEALGNGLQALALVLALSTARLFAFSFSTQLLLHLIKMLHCNVSYE